MQNLTVVVGNPCQRCFANAPWRAFTWLRAFLQEHNLQPWGTIRDAVQESLETAEALDIQRLPGLLSLWRQHDLNAQGDASHFVNTLRLETQSRAFTYRYAEIRPGGQITKHHRALNPHGSFTVPVSLDGFSRKQKEYIPVALICHKGHNHLSSHYYTILMYRDLLWLADDGQPRDPRFEAPHDQ